MTSTADEYVAWLEELRYESPDSQADKDTCPICGMVQGALGYCVVEGEIHSRYETTFVVLA